MHEGRVQEQARRVGALDDHGPHHAGGRLHGARARGVAVVRAPGVRAETIRGVAVAHMSTTQASRLENTKELLDGAIGF